MSHDNDGQYGFQGLAWQEEGRRGNNPLARCCQAYGERQEGEGYSNRILLVPHVCMTRSIAFGRSCRLQHRPRLSEVQLYPEFGSGFGSGHDPKIGSETKPDPSAKATERIATKLDHCRAETSEKKEES